MNFSLKTDKVSLFLIDNLLFSLLLVIGHKSGKCFSSLGIYLISMYLLAGSKLDNKPTNPVFCLGAKK